MEPQQPTNPITDDDDDVEGHRRTIAVEGGQDDTDDVEGHRRTIGVDGGQDDTDDVEGHLTGALGSKTDHER
jgi:hypothetical protein